MPKKIYLNNRLSNETADFSMSLTTEDWLSVIQNKLKFKGADSSGIKYLLFVEPSSDVQCGHGVLFDVPFREL